MTNPYDKSGAAGGNFYLIFEITIETEQGQRVVRTPYSALYTFTGNDGYLDCFAYPDTRASKLKILLFISGDHYHYQEYTLTPHRHFNFAYIEDAEFGDLNATTLATLSNSYWDYNRVQATELMNLFYYPTKNSYRVGHGIIVGLSANAIAISTGQFGEYPMFVFTTDGIWSLQIGNQDVLIQSIKPLARHVCNNSKSILPIDGGSVFSTEKGLFIISGEKIIEISREAEGQRLSVISANSDYTSLLTSTGADDLVCDDKFLEYLSTASIGYDYLNNEIIVSALYHEYSWVYNVDNGMWYKIAQIWDFFMSDFPTMYGVNMNNRDVEDLADEITNANQIIHIETRPLTLGITGLKKITRTLLETYLVIATANTLQVQVFGSTDGVNYALAYHYTVSNDTVQRILIGRTIFSCEYYIFVISSSAAYYDGQIRKITMEVMEKFSKKLRNDM